MEALEKLAEHLGYTTTPFVFAAVAYGFFHWLDEKASDEAKHLLAQTMMWKDKNNEQVASALVEVFDRIYTYPLLRWRAFFRSLVFTIVIFALYLFEIGGPAIWKWPADYSILWSVALLINIISDYVSLFIIRPLLMRSGAKPVIGLSLGAASGIAIVLLGNSLRTILIWPFVIYFAQTEYEPSLLERLNTYYGSFSGFESLVWFAVSASDIFIIFSRPALAVFTWLPLFAVGILIARLLTPLSWLVGMTQWALKEGNEHPLKAIGYVAGVVVFLGTVAGRAAFG